VAILISGGGEEFELQVVRGHDGSTEQPT